MAKTNWSYTSRYINNFLIGKEIRIFLLSVAEVVSEYFRQNHFNIMSSRGYGCIHNLSPSVSTSSSSSYRLNRLPYKENNNKFQHLHVIEQMDRQTFTRRRTTYFHEWDECNAAACQSPAEHFKALIYQTRLSMRLILRFPSLHNTALLMTPRIIYSSFVSLC